MLIEGLPALTINFNGISYQPIALTFAQLDANGALHIVTHPVNATPSILKAQSGTLVTISFAGPSPLSELFTLTTADDTQTVSQALVPAGSSVSYTLPTQPGLYNLHVALHWTGSNPLTSQATYVFRLQIGS